MTTMYSTMRDNRNEEVVIVIQSASVDKFS